MFTKFDVDVAVIGASTAGLLSAYHLARAGYRVTVFEQYTAVNPARRTLIITPYMKKVLPVDFDDAVLHETAIMAVAGPTAHAEIRLAEPDLIVERKALTRLLSWKAQDAGAVVELGYQLVRMQAIAGGVRLFFQVPGNKEEVFIDAQAVIGADGVKSTVARLAGIGLPPSVPILQAEVALPAGWDPTRVQVWFDRKMTRFFYWLIPESSVRGVVGLVADKGQNIRALLEDFLRRNGLRPLAFQGAQVAMHTPRLRPWGKVGDAPVYLVGDAAGQVKVTTVGGTITGFLGARAAAQAIIEGVPYRRTLREVKRELDLHWWVRVALDRMDNAGYDALIRALTPEVREFLSRRTRDEMAGALVGVVLRTPALWRLLPHVLGLASLFRPREVPTPAPRREIDALPDAS